MRILYLIDTLEVGGAERSLLEIASRFRYTEPIVCHVYPGSSLKQAYQQAGIPVISLNVAGEYNCRRAVREVMEVVKQERPHLIHTTLFRSDMVGQVVGRRRGVPVISSFVSESYAPIRRRRLSLSRQIKLRCVQGLNVLSARSVSHFIANSQTVKVANAKVLRVPLQKVSVIYRGRDPAAFVEPESAVLAQTLSELRLQPESRIVLNVARLREGKGQAELIQAMPAILASFPEARLLIAGEGSYRPALQALVEDMGLNETVRLLGQREDIPDLLHMAEVFAFPSHYEGWPGALVEAMLAGRPIVASDIPVHREAITDGETARLVAVQSPEAIAKGVLEMLREPERAREMGERARRLAMERFHINRIAAEYEALYGRVLEHWKVQREGA